VLSQESKSKARAMMQEQHDERIRLGLEHAVPRAERLPDQVMR